MTIQLQKKKSKKGIKKRKGGKEGREGGKEGGREISKQAPGGRGGSKEK